MSMPNVSEANTVIKIENVGLRYYVPRERIESFKEYVIRKVQGKIVYEEFWALKNVSFTVNRGDVFGIVGQNGAGKSTLLKLIARVLKPISGRVWVNGNVAPLLSVGAGFHQELTGRENIFLNGTLLGFTQREMEEKFDRIVEFSGLKDFIDAPLRSYSSGMTARLGFAVATDGKPDILIVDEVLAVGDEAFQAKCFARIKSYQEEGVTTLFVTHNSDRIRKICNRAIWLEKGQLKMTGNATDVVNSYVETVRPGPKPMPNPAQNAAANPGPKPMPNPAPNAAPNPAANPSPKPLPNPAQNAAPNPAANPGPKPMPNPAQNAVPNPAANPGPKPMPNPAQNAAPNPAANPGPKPMPNPAPNAAPNPAANPGPKPMPNPAPNAVPNPVDESLENS